MSSSAPGNDRRPKGKEGAPSAPTPAAPTESHTILFEWPLTGLKSIFESSKPEAKSKVVKSVPFGNGRWTVLFYAASGVSNFSSIYLNAEPLPSERIQPVISTPDFRKKGTNTNISSYSIGVGNGNSSNNSQQQSSMTASATDADPGWEREGLFRFTFTVQTVDKQTVLGTKEAHDHAFSQKTSNWGWAQFIKRDTVYFSNSAVQQADAFLITVSIQASPSRPKIVKPLGISVPPVLVQSYGMLLDDPEHSDVVFHLVTPHKSGTKTKYIYAIKKVLAARSEYFKDMFEGGFIEGEQNDDDVYDDDEDDYEQEDDIGRQNDHTDANQAHEHADAKTDDVDVTMVNRDGDTQPTASSSGTARSKARKTGITVSTAASSSSSSSLLTANNDNTSSKSKVTKRARKRKQGSSSAAGVDQFQEHELLLQDSDAEVEPYDQKRLNCMSDAEDVGAGTTSRLSTSPTTSHLSHRFQRDVSLAEQQRGQMTQEAPRQADAKGKRRRSMNSGSKDQGRRRRRKVVVRDSSYATFRSLLFYLYTDSIEFAPLTSSYIDSRAIGGGDPWGRSPSSSSSSSDFNQEMLRAHSRRQEAIAEYSRKYPLRPIPCSAKAMYRLADKLQLTDLKQRSYDHISNSLTVQNIVWEAFSSFTIQFNEILKMEMEFLLKNWKHVKKTKNMKTIFTRSSFTIHPGLIEIWPYLLSQLDYRSNKRKDSILNSISDVGSLSQRVGAAAAARQSIGGDTWNASYDDEDEQEDEDDDSGDEVYEDDDDPEDDDDDDDDEEEEQEEGQEQESFDAHEENGLWAAG
ncbi:unnamed protein product [Sympodiomycopsis kandeliae]